MQQKFEFKYIIEFLIILFVVVVNFGSGIFNNFVDYDDILFFSENDFFLNNDISFFLKNSFKGHYQPVFWSLLIGITAIIGKSAINLKILALILHVLNCLLLKEILNRFVPSSRFIVLGLTLIFSSAALNSEAILWSSAISTLLSTSLGFMAFLLFLKTYNADNNKYSFSWSCLIIYSLAVFTKNTVIMLPAVCIYILFTRSWSWKELLKFSIFLIPFFISVYVTISSVNEFGSTNMNHIMTDMDISERILMMPTFFWYYPFKLFFPIHLSSPYFIPFSNLQWVKYGLFSLTILVLIRLAYSLLKKKELNGLIIYAILILPVLQIIPVGDNPIGDRFGYFPLIGVLIGIANLLHNYEVESSKLKFILIIGPLIFLSFSFVQNSERIKVWNNSIALYEDCRLKWPKEPYPYFALGVVKLDMLPNQAIKHFLKSKNMGFKSEMMNYNLAIGYINTGNFKLAAKYLVLYTSAVPSKEGLLNLGNCYFKLRDFDSAIESYGAALKIDPDYSKAKDQLGNAFFRVNDREAACKLWEESNSVGKIKKYCQ